jgi:uncharacterized membrane protein (UPF0127 family)
VSAPPTTGVPSSLQGLVDLASRQPGLRWLRRVVWLMLVLSIGTFIVRGADRPKDPKLIPANASVPSAVRGFDEVSFTIVHPTSATAAARPSHCALLAKTDLQRARGLMNRRDLAGYEAMVFEWQGPTADEFYMKDTLIPLSVAWFKSTGQFIGSADMAPCLVGPCHLYSAPGPYTIAIEVPQGSLSYFGIGSGSSVTAGGPCGS